MAEKKAQFDSPVSAQRYAKEVKVKWLNFTATNDVGEPLSALHLADKSVQMVGTFDTTTMLIQGSNNGGDNWDTLTDPQGNALSFTGTGFEQIMEIAELIRPKCSVGGGNTDVDVFLVAKGEMI